MHLSDAGDRSEKTYSRTLAPLTNDCRSNDRSKDNLCHHMTTETTRTTRNAAISRRAPTAAATLTSPSTVVQEQPHSLLADDSCES